jgi:peroxiredoxin Q/BCP
MTPFGSMLTAALATIGLASPASDLAPGMEAPAFRAQDQGGNWVSLADFKGKVVVLYFYPKDDTPGCTKEACSLRDGYGALLETGAIILGVSADKVDSHAAFAGKFHLPFPILADPGLEIIKAYGVSMPLVGMAKRVTFIIGKDGRIRDVIRDVDAAGHDKQVLARLKTP